MTVRNFATKLASLLVVVFGMVPSYVTLARAQAPVQSAISPSRSGIAPLPRVTSPRLYVIDCGALTFNRPEDYNLTRRSSRYQYARALFPRNPLEGPSTVRHWPLGSSRGRPVYENVVFGYGQIKFNTLKGQLADIGVSPADITYLALSHSHFDHVGNANEFAGSIWLAQKAEYDLMFGAPR